MFLLALIYIALIVSGVLIQVIAGFQVAGATMGKKGGWKRAGYKTVAWLIVYALYIGIPIQVIDHYFLTDKEKAEAHQVFDRIFSNEVK